MRRRMLAIVAAVALLAPLGVTATGATPHRAARACRGCPLPVVRAPGQWQPTRGMRWQIQLQASSGHCATGGFSTSSAAPPYGGGPDVSPTVFAIDLYADDGACPAYAAGTPNADAVDAIHTAGGYAIAYISAGSWERWRPDAGVYIAYDNTCGGCLLGKTLGGYPDERYVNIHAGEPRRFLLHRMKVRMRRAVGAGFDGVYFDNQDEYHWTDTGFPITRRDQLLYLTRLLNAARRLGLAAGPNNDILQTARFEPYADLQINESCFRYSECRFMRPMLDAGKPVFEIEYSKPLSAYCPAANRRHFSTIKKVPALYDLPWVSCR
ncbi:MAG: endo alpha-1,4 polygalactosaminidase [Actinomycetota bacterium]